jgi:succinoglycan biosynthesis transport protein ExoP
MENQSPSSPLARSMGGGLAPRGAGMPPVSSAGGARSGLTPKDIVQILRKRKWLILVCLVFFTGSAVGATILWAKYAPSFTATALLEVVNNERDPWGAPGETFSPGMKERLETEANLVRGDAIIQRALQSEDARKTRWFEENENRNPNQLLKQALSVSPVRDTRLIRVSVTVNNPRDAATLATAVAEAYQIHSDLDMGEAYVKQLDRLGSERDRLKEEISQLETQIKDMARQSDAQERQAKYGRVVTELTSTMLELRRMLTDAENNLRELRSLQASDALVSAGVVQAQLWNDKGYVQLKAQELNLNNEIKTLLDMYEMDHQQVQRSMKRFARVQEEIALFEANATKGVVDNAQEIVTLLTTELDAVEAELQKNITELRELSRRMAELELFKSKRLAASTDLTRIETGIMETRLMQDRNRSVALARAAEPPTERSQPKFEFMVPAGVVLGLIIGIGITVLLELADTSIRRPSDVSTRVDLPLLGMIPHADDLEDDIDDVYLAMETHPDSPFGESMRQIRTRLVFSAPMDEQRSLVITSPSPEDGRSVVAVNLAITMAQAGARVLLVDANFRQPRISQLFEAGQKGLSDALTAQANWSDLITEVRTNLYVMASGPLPPNPAELLGSDQMRQMVAEMSERFDRVLFDVGPALVVSDAMCLASMTDGVVMVLRAGVNSLGVAQRTRNTLKEANGHILGVVLNGVRAMAGGYLRKHYETFYEYREPAQLPGA